MIQICLIGDFLLIKNHSFCKINAVIIKGMDKSYFYFLIIFLTTIVSCTTDNGIDQTENRLMLPKTLIVNYGYSDSDVISFTYEGNKIKSILSKSQKNEYVYSGNKIVLETKYKIVNNQDIKLSETSFSYVNNKLYSISTIENENVKERKYIFLYNDDGTIKKEDYYFDDPSGKVLQSDSNDVLTFDKGNLIKSVYDWGNNRDVITSSRYEYDTKNNAFKNVLGFNKLLYDLDLLYELNVFSANNITKHVNSPIKSGTIIFEPYANTMIYDYDKNGYPTKRTTYDFMGEKIQELEYRY